MKKKFIFFLVLTAVIPFLTESCKLTSPDDNDVVTESGKLTIIGEVIDSVSGNPLIGAVIFIETDSLDFGDATDAGGQFSIEINIKKSQTVYISVTKEGYYERVFYQRVIAGNNVEMPAFKLKPFDDIAEKSVEPASINLYSQSSESIGVKESGAVESAEIIFEVRDSSGVILDLDHKVTVNFRLSQSPGGGEYLYPSSAVTNGKGQVAVAINSGTIAGVVQVIAEISFNGSIIRSKPILIAIHSGLPDQEHFDIAIEQINVPGLLEIEKYSVTAFVGDKYSNRVRQGTSVYFKTTGGFIDGSALTDEEGEATVLYTTSNPIPSHPTYGSGYGVITATTIDEDSNYISVEHLILFTGSPDNIQLSPSSFSIPNGGSQTFNLTVTDVNGNPLAKNSSIVVTAEGSGVSLKGTTNVIMPDVLTGNTQFTFFLEDSDPEEDKTSSIVLTIKATTALKSGSYSREISFQGTSR